MRTVISIQDQIADQLRSDIIAGLLQPGERLRESELASKFGVSRGPIRDVFLQLSKEGLLVTRRNRGVTVNEHLSPDLQTLMVDLRLQIEIYAISKLSAMLTDEDVMHMEGLLGTLDAALKRQDFAAVTEADLAFHRYMVERAGGEDLINIWTLIVMRMRMDYKRIADPQDSIDEHRAILEALRTRDAKALKSALRANIR